MKRHGALVVAIGIILSSGCSRHGNSVSPLTRRPPTVVRIRNSNWLDMTVCEVRGTARIRLGFVRALGTATFRVPNASIPDRTLRLLVDPIGSENVYLTDGVTVAPGQLVELTIMPSLAMSSLAVWPR